MKDREKRFTARSKIWIVDAHDNVVFGPGRMRILKAVAETGSMNAAAKALQMSYRAVWGRVRESENRIGKELVVRKGKGSHLTPFALEMMQKFDELESTVSERTDEIFSTLLAQPLTK